MERRQLSQGNRVEYVAANGRMIIAEITKVNILSVSVKQPRDAMGTHGVVNVPLESIIKIVR